VKLRSQKGQIPTWLKVVIGIAVLAIIGVIGLFVVAVSIGGKLLGSATDVKATEKVAHQIVMFDGDLPPGWKYTMNMDMLGMKMVSLMNMENKTMVNLMQLPNPKHQSASDMVNNPSLEHSKYSGSSRFTVESRGEETIGGEKVPYVRAKMQDGKEMEMGFVVLPNGKAVMIQVIEPTSTYDPALAQPVIDKIKGYVG
jgi:hypothetical protein